MSGCTCRCHASSGSHISCDQGPVQPGGEKSCTWLHNEGDGSDEDRCGRCGAREDEPHQWVEGDCVLPHRNHSRSLIPESFVCEPCVERWDEWLGEITDLYATLDEVLLVAEMADDDTAEHSRPKKAPASPSPIRLAAWALWRNEVTDHVVNVSYDSGKRVETTEPTYLGSNLPDIPAVMSGWAQTVWDEMGWTGQAPQTVNAAVGFLRANIFDAARSPHADDIDAELRWVRRSLRSAHGITDPEPLFACLDVDCGGSVWQMTIGNPACDHCGRRYGTLDYVRARGDGLKARRRLQSRRDGTGGRP